MPELKLLFLQMVFAWLERCAPFGIGNPEPVFVSRGVVLRGMPRRIKEKHICLQIRRSPLSQGGDLSAPGAAGAIGAGGPD